MESQIVSYHYCGEEVYPEGLLRRLSSCEYLMELISKFSATKPCIPISEISLKNVAVGSKAKFTTTRCGDLVSLKCNLIADKGNHCVNCRNLKRSLGKKFWFQHHAVAKGCHNTNKCAEQLNYKRQVETLMRKTQVFLRFRLDFGDVM